MFDISWTEFLLIGIVALVVIGPKELPAVMRTMGQWMRKVRSMATDFQNQFHEAMREAEMADLKKQVDDVAHDIKHYDPLKEVRTDVEAMGKGFESSLEPKPATAGAVSAPDAPAPAPAAAEASPAAVASEPPPAADIPLAQGAAELRDENVLGAAAGPAAPPVAENAANAESAGRT